MYLKSGYTHGLIILGVHSTHTSYRNTTHTRTYTSWPMIGLHITTFWVWTYAYNMESLYTIKSRNVSCKNYNLSLYIYTCIYILIYVYIYYIYAKMHIYICQNKGCEYPTNQQNTCPAATPTCIYIYAMILSSILAGICIYIYIYQLGCY